MFKGGRPKASVWEHFNKISVDDKPHGECKLCQTKVCYRSDRLKVHFTKCSVAKKSSVKRARSPTPESPPRKIQVSTRQPTIFANIIKTSSELKDSLDVKICSRKKKMSDSPST